VRATGMGGAPFVCTINPSGDHVLRPATTANSLPIMAMRPPPFPAVETRDLRIPGTDFPLETASRRREVSTVLSPNEPGSQRFNITRFDDAGGTG